MNLLLRRGCAFVISPLKALMSQQMSDLQRRRIPATFINGDLSPQEKEIRWSVLPRAICVFVRFPDLLLPAKCHLNHLRYHTSLRLRWNKPPVRQSGPHRIGYETVWQFQHQKRSLIRHTSSIDDELRERKIRRKRSPCIERRIGIWCHCTFRNELGGGVHLRLKPWSSRCRRARSPRRRWRTILSSSNHRRNTRKDECNSDNSHWTSVGF